MQIRATLKARHAVIVEADETPRRSRHKLQQPTIKNGRLLSTLAAFGMPSQARWSANEW